MSAWLREHGKGKGKIRCGEIANGRYRAIDPWHHIKDGIVVRRLSPNNRKIEADEDPGPLLSPDMLDVMGADLAGVHLGTSDCAEAIKRDLAHRKRGWLKTYATKNGQGCGGRASRVDGDGSPNNRLASGRSDGRRRASGVGLLLLHRLGARLVLHALHGLVAIDELDDGDRRGSP